MTALAQVPDKLSPAQKAWVTRRARDEKREIITATKTGVDTPSPLEGEKIVSMVIDDDTGRRLYVVLEIGDRWATLLYVPQLSLHRVDRLSFDRYGRASPGSSPRKTARLIRQQMKTWKQCFPDQHELACKRGERAIAILRERE
jgi:hypothetical protein